MANKLDARIRNKDVAKKKKPKSRIGAAIAPLSSPQPNMPKPPQPRKMIGSEMPKATSISGS
tara:strand:- start:870 stop:1055 length:186 start_codon:yes stop_codon:yes gene_type:complete